MTSPIEECETCVGMPVAGPQNPLRENGLFQAATVTRRNDAAHWPMVGFQWETQHCAPGWRWTRPCSQLTVALDKGVVALGLDFANAVPFTAGVSVSCLRDPTTDFAPRARQRFDEDIEQLVEQTLWADRWGPLVNPNGVVPSDPRITVPDASIADPTIAVDPVLGLALLEEAIGSSYSRIGVIHAPRRAAPTYANLMQIERRAGRPFTPLGNRWAFGAGYRTGADPLRVGQGTRDEVWLVATGAVAVFIGPLIERQGFDLKKNMDLAVAEAPAAVGYECPAFAIKVKIHCETCPGVTP